MVFSLRKSLNIINTIFLIRKTNYPNFVKMLHTIKSYKRSLKSFLTDFSFFRRNPGKFIILIFFNFLPCASLNKYYILTGTNYPNFLKR